MASFRLLAQTETPEVQNEKIKDLENDAPCFMLLSKYSMNKVDYEDKSTIFTAI